MPGESRQQVPGWAAGGKSGKSGGVSSLRSHEHDIIETGYEKYKVTLHITWDSCNLELSLCQYFIA